MKTGLRLSLTSIFFASILSFSQTAFSQMNIDFSTCNAIVREGLKDTYDSQNSIDSYEKLDERIRKANFQSYQEAKSNAASIGIDIPILDGILGLDGSDTYKQSEFRQKYDEFSSSSYANRISKIKNHISSSQINSNLLASYNYCLDTHRIEFLGQYGLLLSDGSFVFDNDNNISKFTVTVTKKDNLGDAVLITSVEPQGSVVCKYANQSITVSPEHPFIISNRSKTFPLTCFPTSNGEFDFKLGTPGFVSNSFRVPSRNAFTLALQKKANDAEYLNRQLTNSLSAFKTQLDTLTGNFNNLTLDSKEFPSIRSMEVVIAGANHPNHSDGTLVASASPGEAVHHVAMPGVKKGLQAVWFTPVDNLGDLSRADQPFGHVSVELDPADPHLFLVKISGAPVDALLRLKVYGLDR